MFPNWLQSSLPREVLNEKYLKGTSNNQHK